MRKIVTSQFIATTVIVSCIIILAVIGMRSCSGGRAVVADLSPTDITVGEAVFFRDSTKGAKQWHWEFGNGDASYERSGEYIFTEAGRYQVRLTVNGNPEKYFLVRVREAVDNGAMMLVDIYAPLEAVQGQYVMFKGIGEAKEWRWEFGESGIVDSRDQNVLYKYENPGLYEVLLNTDITKYPIRHTISIMPLYTPSDSTDMLTIIGQEIKTKLQAIADGKSFNQNYYAVLTKYFNNNPNTMVCINNNKYNDFYSYCQGLKLTGRANKTYIENVLPDMDQQTQTYISNITVIQYDDRK